MKQARQQKGQALILIVFAMIGLVGITALAIDGGNAYSDRRHAQNAADTAALAAGLRKIRGYTDWDAIAKNMAASNGYPPSGPRSSVRVYMCDAVPSGEPECVLAPDEEHPEDYIQVVITSIVKTYFAPVIGIRQITNTVQAIAKAVPGTVTPWVMGNALVALMPGCKDNNWNYLPFSIGGNQLSIVNGSGVFVNSSCDSAFKQSSNSTINAPGGVCIVGGIDPTSSIGQDPVQPQEHCGTQLQLSMYVLPPLSDDSCSSNGQIIDEGGGVKRALPGRYAGAFPSASYTKLLISKGIYCLHNGISIQGSGLVTTDINDNGSTETNEGALFFVEDGDVNISGGNNTSVFLSGIPTGGISSDLANYLFYMPPSNPGPIKLTGGSSNSYFGTILAPGALVTLDGGSTSSGTSTLNLETQIIGYSINLTGGGTLNITYNAARNAVTWTNPQLSQYK
jgi:hypothetical protein